MRGHFSGRHLASNVFCDFMPPSASRPTRALPNPPASVDGWKPDAPAIVYETAGLAVAHWKNVAIHLWTGSPSTAMVMKLDELSPAFASAHPRGISSIHIIAQGTPLPEGDVRHALRSLTNKYAKNIACVCHVVEGAGFWASALQSFLTGFHFALRDPFELHICATLEMAARWMPEPHVRRTGVFVPTHDLEAALRTVRSRGG